MIDFEKAGGLVPAVAQDADTITADMMQSAMRIAGVSFSADEQRRLLEKLNGARGYSKDTVLEWIYRYARQARLVDGASEVHNMVLARFMREEGRDFWRWSAGNRV